VVLGGNSHTVFDDEVDVFSSTTLSTAITNALAAPSSVESNGKINSDFQLSLFPNPVKSAAKVTYTLNRSEDVIFEIYNILGSKVKTISQEKQNTGKHETEIDVESLNDGIYFIQLKVAEASQMLKFTIYK